MVGELFGAWLLGRVLDGAAGYVSGPQVEKASADCFRIAARSAARAALERRGAVVDEEAIVHLTESFERIFDLNLREVGVVETEVSGRPMWQVLQDAVAERFDLFDELPTPDDVAQATELGIDTDAVARDFFVGLIEAMRGRPELQPLRSALFDEVHTAQLDQLLAGQTELQQLLTTVRREMAMVGVPVEAGQPQQPVQQGEDPTGSAPLAPKRRLPDGFEPGRLEEARLVRAVLEDEPSSSVVGLTTALVGAGGFGKTTSAEWLIAQSEVKARFERILWIEVGDDLDLARVVAGAYRELTGHAPAATDLGHLTTLFARAVGSRRLLMVVDDVWTRQALTPFIDENWNAVTVVTTRRRDVLPDGAVTIEIDEISEAIARRIAGRDLDLDPSALAPLLERAKGWPLLLRLLNRAVYARIRGRQSMPAVAAVQSVVVEYDQTGPANFDPSDAQDRRRAVAASVGVGIGQLRDRQVPGVGELSVAYRLLGIFPPDTRIPLDVLQQLYSATNDSTVSLPAVRRACQLLHEQSLVQRFDADADWIELHDEIREHLRRDVGHELLEPHGRLLDAVRPADGWGALPDEPDYWWQHLAWHLVETGRADELADTVLDPNYLLSKVCRAGPVALEADLRAARPTRQIQVLERMLRQDGFCLLGFGTAGQAAPTFAARLAGTPELPELRAGIEGLATTPWLRPERQAPDLPSPALQRTLVGHPGGVVSVAWSNDGDRLATASGSTVGIWRGDEPKPVRVVHNSRQDRVHTVVWSPDGTRLAIASQDQTVRIWDADAPAVDPVVLTGHQDHLRSVAWSPDGTRLASASHDHTVRVWQLKDPTVDPVVLTGHRGWVNSVAWSPDGTRLASASHDRTVRIWDADSLHAFPLALTRHKGVVESVAWSADSTRLASVSSDRTVRIWDTSRPQSPVTLTGHRSPLTSVAWSPNSTHLASASHDRTVRIWDTGDLDGDPVVLTGHESAVMSVAWSPDGARLASASSDRTVRIWDTEEIAADRTLLSGPQEEVVSVAWSPNGTRIASASSNTVRIWHADDPEAAPVAFTGGRAMRSVEWSPDGTLLALASSDPTVRIWHANDPDAVPVALTADGHETGSNAHMKSVAWSPDGTRLACASSSRVRIWATKKLSADPVAFTSLVVLINEHAREPSVTWSPDGTRLASASHDGTVRIWDPDDPSADPVVLTGHQGRVASVAWSPAGTRLASASWDNTVRIWDADDHSADPVVLTGHQDRVASVAWSPSGTWLASASQDRTVRLWSLCGKETSCLVGAVRLSSIAWHPQLDRLIVAGAAGWHILQVR